MKRRLSVLLVLAMLICCSQSFVVPASAASIVSSQSVTKSWFSSLWDWLFPQKEEETIAETVAPTIANAATPISETSPAATEAPLQENYNGVITKLDQVIQKYPDGSYWNDTFDGGNTCYGFAKLVVYNVFGKSTSPGKVYRSWLYNGTSKSGMITVGTATSLSSESMKQLLSNARPGDVLQLDKGVNKKQHSLIIYNVADDGVTIYESGVPNTRLHFVSYGYWSNRDNPKATLLRSDNYDIVNGSSTENITDSAPVINISQATYPSSVHKKGENFGIRGIISCDSGIITEVYGALIDQSGNTVQYGKYNPNTSSHNLRYSINNDLIFDRLSAGSYVYRVRATAKNGSKETTQTLIDCPFQVQGEQSATVSTPESPAAASQKPTLRLSGETLPSSQQQGRNFGIRGTVSTDCGTITYLHGGLIDASGNEVQSGKYYPNASSVDLRYTINNDLIFDNLSAGEYTYIVEATAQNGNEQTTQSLIQHKFQVIAPAAAAEPARTPVLSISGQNLPQDQKIGSNFGIRGTVSTDCGTITELYGAILDTSGNAVCSGRYNPYSASVDLRTTINNDLVFGTLGVGSYTYFVQAKAENNGQQTVQTMIEQAFTVIASAAESQQPEPALNSVGYNMTVNVGRGSTLRFCSTVSTADPYEIGSIPNGAVVYVYGYTQQQYESRTWAKISYNGINGWVNYKWLG